LRPADFESAASTCSATGARAPIFEPEQRLVKAPRAQCGTIYSTVQADLAEVAVGAVGQIVIAAAVGDAQVGVEQRLPAGRCLETEVAHAVEQARRVQLLVVQPFALVIEALPAKFEREAICGLPEK
jgi:hypothetical protein